MKRSLLALAVTGLVGGGFAATAAATTFPALTTIYVGSGVADTGSGENAGTATTFHCTNASGLLANIRFLVLSPAGLPLASAGFNSVPHGATRTISTHPTLAFSDIPWEPAWCFKAEQSSKQPNRAFSAQPT